MRRKTWQRVEQREADLRGGRVQPGSGSQWHSKGDVKTATHLVQVKSTEKKQYVLKLSDLEQIEREALNNNRDPEMVVVFLTSTGPRRYRIIRDYGTTTEISEGSGRGSEAGHD